MQIAHHNIAYRSRADTFKLWHITDPHIGAAACHEDRLSADIRRIADDPKAYWIGGGDYIDAICHVGDKRYDPAALAPWALGESDVMGAQIDRTVEMFKPIAHKCLGLISGNHESAALKYYSRNVYWEIVKGLARQIKKRPEDLALGVQGFVVLHFRRYSKNSSGNGWPLTIYAHHGYGGGRMPGGHALTLGRVLANYECDIALLGHRHVEMHVIHPVVMVRGGTIHTQHRMAIFTASYLGNKIERASGAPVDSYAEQFGLPPLKIGASPLLIDPDARAYHYVSTGGNFDTNFEAVELPKLVAKDKAA